MATSPLKAGPAVRSTLPVTVAVNAFSAAASTIRTGLVNLTAFENNASVRRTGQAGYDIEKRGLAAAGMADDRDILSLRHIERDAAKHLGRLRAALEGLIDVIDLEIHDPLLRIARCRG